jgi:hypothetical protein
MIGNLIGAVLRFMQLQKLAKLTRVQAAYEKAKAWYKRQPREIQIIVLAGSVLTLIATLFA